MNLKQSIWEMSVTEPGTVFEKASEAGGWTVLPEEERKKLIDASVEEAITDYGNSVLYSTARNEQMIVRMKQMLERTVWHLRTS